jgi:hypothetical protein
VMIQENRPDEVCHFFSSIGMKSEQVERRKAGREALSIWKFYKSNE